MVCCLMQLHCSCLTFTIQLFVMTNSCTTLDNNLRHRTCYLRLSYDENKEDSCMSLLHPSAQEQFLKVSVSVILLLPLSASYIIKDMLITSVSFKTLGSNCYMDNLLWCNNYLFFHEIHLKGSQCSLHHHYLSGFKSWPLCNGH